MQSVAIVGFSPKTLKYLTLTPNVDEIWTLNHAYLCVGESIPRIDRLFEIHKKDWFLRKEIPKSVAYWEWLQQPQTFPVYMQEVMPEVPASVRYPIEEVCADIFANLVRMVDGKEVHDTYLTSTAAMMLALAIHELTGVPGARIELYGVDMESNTEYGYQKAGGESMVFMAAGRGIKVVRPEPSELCRAPIYGYEGVPYIDAHRVKEMYEAYKTRKEYYDDQLRELMPTFNPSEEASRKKFLEISSWEYVYQGGMLICERLLNESDTYISRNIIEMKRTAYMNHTEYHKGQTNKLKAQFELHFKDGEGDPAVFTPIWEKYLSERAEMFGHMAACEALDIMIRLIDFRPTEYDLHMGIVEN